MAISPVTRFFNPEFKEKKLHFLENAIPDPVKLPEFPHFFSHFRKAEQQREVGKKLGKGVRAMASYLALSHGAGASVAKIREVGKILARERISFSEEDRALLERVRLSALLREHPEQLEAIKEHINVYLKTKLNKELFAKWKKEGFAEDAFLFNPTVPAFIFKTHLHNSVKAFGDSFQYEAATHEFRVLVDGVYRNVADMAEALGVQEKKRLGSVVTGLVNKSNPKEKWCYLPATGLRKWDEDGWKKLLPCAKLTPSQVEFAQTSARRNDGSPGQKGDYVVEIVSSMMDYKEIPLLSGYQETFKRFRHPWIRIITPNGDFYSVGFNIGDDLVRGQPAASVKGIFKGPDSWETLPFSKRPVTGFARSKETCDAIIREVESYQKQTTSFNIIEKNCSAFIERVRDILDPASKQKNVTFAADITELFQRCLPKTIQAIGRKVAPMWRVFKYVAGQCCAPIIIKVAKVVAAFFRLILERTVLAISGRWFSYGGRDTSFPHKDPHKGIPWYQFITHLDIALKERLVRLYLPGKVGEWQLSLPQTRLIEKDTPLFAQYEKASTV